MITFWNLQILLKRFFKYKGQKQPPEVFYEKSCSQKFRKLHRKTPVSESLAQVVSCGFWKIFQNTFFTEHLWTTASEEVQGVQYSKYIFFVLKNGSFIHVSLGHVRSVNDSSTTMNALRKIQKHSPADVLLKGCCRSSVRNTYDGVHF